jgi:hypothetical protein
MLESPAYRALSLSAHRVLARIEIEYAHHGHTQNGKLPITFDHFVEYGIDRHAIAPAIRETEALGFIEVTERGVGGNADAHRPSLYRLTYRDVDGVLSDGTHEWRRIKTMAEALAAAKNARATQPENSQRRGSRVRRLRPKLKNQWGKPTSVPVRETHTGKPIFPVGKTPTTVPVGETPTTSISRRRGHRIPCS